MLLAKLYYYLQSTVADFCFFAALKESSAVCSLYLLKITVVYVESIGENLNVFVFPVSFLILSFALTSLCNMVRS